MKALIRTANLVCAASVASMSAAMAATTPADDLFLEIAETPLTTSELQEARGGYSAGGFKFNFAVVVQPVQVTAPFANGSGPLPAGGPLGPDGPLGAGGVFGDKNGPLDTSGDQQAAQSAAQDTAQAMVELASNIVETSTVDTPAADVVSLDAPAAPAVETAPVVQTAANEPAPADQPSMSFTMTGGGQTETIPVETPTALAAAPETAPSSDAGPSVLVAISNPDVSSPAAPSSAATVGPESTSASPPATVVAAAAPETPAVETSVTTVSPGPEAAPQAAETFVVAAAPAPAPAAADGGEQNTVLTQPAPQPQTVAAAEPVQTEQPADTSMSFNMVAEPVVQNSLTTVINNALDNVTISRSITMDVIVDNYAVNTNFVRSSAFVSRAVSQQVFMRGLN